MMMLVLALVLAIVPAVAATVVAFLTQHHERTRILARRVFPCARRRNQHAIRNAAHVDAQPWAAPRRGAVPVPATQPPPGVFRAEHVVAAAGIVDHLHVVDDDDV